MATIASHKLLFTYYQKDGVDNTTYHRKFMAHVETIETYGGVGAVGIVPAFITQMFKTMHTEGLCSDPDNPIEVELAAARATVHEEFLAGLMLSGANRDRYNALCTELTNQNAFGNDLYLKTINQCLTMLNRHKDPSSHTHHNNQQQQQSRKGTGTPKQEDEALAFAQDSNCLQATAPSTSSASRPPAKGSTSSSSSSSQSVCNKSKITKVFCKNCGKMGHISLVCPEPTPPPPPLTKFTLLQWARMMPQFLVWKRMLLSWRRLMKLFSLKRHLHLHFIVLLTRTSCFSTVSRWSICSLVLNMSVTSALRPIPFAPTAIKGSLRLQLRLTLTIPLCILIHGVLPMFSPSIA